MAGLTDEGRILLDETELRRFYSSCVADLETGCWYWTGLKNPQGYGLFWFRLNGVWVGRGAHVVAYNHFVSIVPQFEELGHVIDGDKCAFYDHVRPVTHQENMAEAAVAGRMGPPLKQFCSHGHDTLRWGRTSRRGVCKVCNRIRASGQDFRGCTKCGFSPCRCQPNHALKIP